MKFKEQNIFKEKKILKSGLDPFLAQAVGYSGIGTALVITVICFFIMASRNYEIYINVTLKGTELILQATLGHEAGVNREVFNHLFEIFKQYNLNLEDQIKALQTIKYNIIEYRDIQAISELEGQKLQQVANELEQIINEKSEILNEVEATLKQVPTKRKEGFIE